HGVNSELSLPRSAAESLGASIGRIGQPVDNARAGATLAPGLLIVLRTPRMVERNRVVRPLRLKTACSRIKGCGCLVAVLLGIAGLGNPNLAAAADIRGADGQRFAVDRANRAAP